MEKIIIDDRISDKIEYDRIIKEGGIVTDGRVNGQLMLSRAFGDWELNQYGVSSEPHVIKWKLIVMIYLLIWQVMECGMFWMIQKFIKCLYYQQILKIYVII